MSNSLAYRWRGLSLGSIVALLAIVFGWQLWPVASIAGIGRAVVLSIPLLLPVAGMWQGKRHTYRWATLCVLPYFVVGFTEVVANPGTRMWTAAMLAFALMWFVGLVAYLRVTSSPIE